MLFEDLLVDNKTFTIHYQNIQSFTIKVYQTINKYFTRRQS